jgi:hypothetical protein
MVQEAESILAAGSYTDYEIPAAVRGTQFRETQNMQSKYLILITYIEEYEIWYVRSL